MQKTKLCIIIRLGVHISTVMIFLYRIMLMVGLSDARFYSFAEKNAGKMQETCRALGRKPQFMDITLLKSVIKRHYLRLVGTKGDSSVRTGRVIVVERAMRLLMAVDLQTVALCCVNDIDGILYDFERCHDGMPPLHGWHGYYAAACTLSTASG
jgi:hypothetical protein